MPIKIKAKINLQRDMKQAKEGFYKLVQNTIVKSIKEFISRGISPVKGQVRYQKYSQSYIDQINMNKAFLTSKSGVVFSIERLTSNELNAYRANRKARSENAAIARKIKELNIKLVTAKKKQSPVNLKVSGDLLNSLTATRTERGVLIKFDDKKAKYHDIDGVGRAGTLRRLLPNTGGRDSETFNDRLLRNIKQMYERSIKKFVKRKG